MALDSSIHLEPKFIFKPSSKRHENTEPGGGVRLSEAETHTITMGLRVVDDTGGIRSAERASGRDAPLSAFPSHDEIVQMTADSLLGPRQVSAGMVQQSLVLLGSSYSNWALLALGHPCLGLTTPDEPSPGRAGNTDFILSMPGARAFE
ncbi:hypothetical protein HD806DRAFT_538013 [Xylariaceae sp. AK1471]|nr:hypothetical protein HD806DRAFT_538013 [Xylariaceae sp. AK1471]